MSHTKVLNIDCAEDSEGDSDSGEHETDKTKKAPPPYGRGLIKIALSVDLVHIKIFIR